jgi:hypothetical protein
VESHHSKKSSAIGSKEKITMTLFLDTDRILWIGAETPKDEQEMAKLKKDLEKEGIRSFQIDGRTKRPIQIRLKLEP